LPKTISPIIRIIAKNRVTTILVMYLAIRVLWYLKILRSALFKIDFPLQ